MTIVVSLRSPSLRPPRPGTSAAASTEPAPGAPALRRFVAHGLIAALDCYRTGGMSSHRFVWELTARIGQLAELDVPDRTVTRLRWLGRTVELYVGSTGAGADSLAAALVELRTVLELLDPFRPLDPTGAGRPVALAAG